ncbi:MAG TPA: 5-oxoprolinase subunit PxpA [Gordonia sp. (in: high G+C Gram-positive bacteria)]|uniref:LamB/YcsF family protein n=1 Tax=unclassified Gordonia (in: high G+C Gram-positive bacteria) TaxID=2657482 RepID=UPI000FA4E1DF|nr:MULTISPECIES: 5-oxoprolinase subunit PxpA [unclassified Gordonia (in: high G+C Gram-positive bacteria)]RUP36494.1 MAG: LamB/YcsF family protein [Gordonia sp. (in: high G+C Gram-positive bacteria)]HNP57001.1 5-oxoprolinase subunit PxpA [Gordonia sp. (in: high G+C Gram-positive bacteria)]HRC50964.1 5-oxoprolinase subunit PxpA [Gordonia sp. (in: high G+C Gram-positive bacteria)]
MTATIDLNADLGEEVGDDEAMLAIVTSANVACGFHAGSPTVLARTCAQAHRRGVAIGAQVSYPDREGFGRRYMAMDPEDLRADIVYQIGALAALASAAGTRVRYVKPHGALYNTIVADEEQAAAVVEAVRSVDPGLPVMGLPGSLVLAMARDAGLPVITEAFADRGYRPDGTLVPRSEPGALLTDSDEIARRVVELVTTGRLTAVDGSTIVIEAESVCLHGDTPGAVEHARTTRAALLSAGVSLAPITRH